MIKSDFSQNFYRLNYLFGEQSYRKTGRDAMTKRDLPSAGSFLKWPPWPPGLGQNQAGAWG